MPRGLLPNRTEYVTNYSYPRIKELLINKWRHLRAGGGGRSSGCPTCDMGSLGAAARGPRRSFAAITSRASIEVGLRVISTAPCVSVQVGLGSSVERVLSPLRNKMLGVFNKTQNENCAMIFPLVFF